ncbi:MAG: hypothetical protein FWF98_02310 [Dehalococcoidia bacterium]|nr:hypothetical protein [Dehalococcoidia bacterium]
MSEQTEWYGNLEAKVETLKAQLGADARDYYLGRFLKIARRIGEFAADCPHCREFQTLMDNMIKDLSYAPTQITKEQKRLFLGNANTILSHLKKTHGLISDGQNTGIFLAIGAGVGVSLGVVFKSPIIGIPAGVALGIVFGAVLDMRARKAGKTI